MRDLSKNWEWVPGWRGYYKASKDGLIKSVSRTIQEKTGKKNFIQSRILKPGVNEAGYLRVVLCRQGKPTSKYLHQLILLTFVGKCPKGMECCHKDDDKTNNHVDNLYYGTHSRNMKDGSKNGSYKNRKYVKGENHGGSKLTKNQVIQIREIWKSHNLTQKEIGKKFKVSAACIYYIINNKTWVE